MPTLQQLDEKWKTLERDNPELWRAIQELLKMNKRVNNMVIGNFYLPETLEGLLSLGDPR